MSWYSHMFKSHEVARKLNRQEQRRNEQERFGPHFVAQYQLAKLEKERKLIEKELERIRKGIHKQPKLENSKRSGKGPHVLDLSWQKGHQTPRDDIENEAMQTIAPEYSKDENELYDAIVFMQNNPSALVPILTAHAQSDAYLETLERISPRLNLENSSTFVPRYIREHVSREEKALLLNKYTEMLHKHSQYLRRNSPVRKSSPAGKSSPQLGQYRSSPVRHTDSPLSHRDSPRLQSKISHEQETDRNSPRIVLSDGGENSVENDVDVTLHNESRTPNSSPSPSLPKSRRQQDIVTLATDGMQKARVNAARRLGTKDGTPTTNSKTTSQKDIAGQQQKQQQEQRDEQQKQTDEQQTVTAPDDAEEEDAVTSANIAADIKNARKTSRAVVMFPTYDPDIYNPDGTLRTVHNMPTFDACFEQAQKARYIRSKEMLERDRELSVKEIFEK